MLIHWRSQKMQHFGWLTANIQNNLSQLYRSVATSASLLFFKVTLNLCKVSFRCLWRWPRQLWSSSCESRVITLRINVGGKKPAYFITEYYKTGCNEPATAVTVAEEINTDINQYNPLHPHTHMHMDISYAHLCLQLYNNCLFTITA